MRGHNTAEAEENNKREKGWRSSQNTIRRRKLAVTTIWHWTNKTMLIVHSERKWLNTKQVWWFKTRCAESKTNQEKMRTHQISRIHSSIYFTVQAFSFSSHRGAGANLQQSLCKSWYLKKLQAHHRTKYRQTTFHTFTHLQRQKRRNVYLLFWAFCGQHFSQFFYSLHAVVIFHKLFMNSELLQQILRAIMSFTASLHAAIAWSCETAPLVLLHMNKWAHHLSSSLHSWQTHPN